ncbi:MAG: tetratricopeptide repeat protein [Candidatus Promineifilaceae bacterium]
MKESDVKDLLEEGIAAAKRGDSERSRDLLLRVVINDQESESAWLWLSSVVDSDEDRVICLQNVLVLNPDSVPAKRGLERLDKFPSKASETKNTVDIEINPASPAASILYPERHQKQWQWEDNIPLRIIGDGAMKSRSDYDDVWERESNICAYCAYEIDFDDNRCPNCRRRLTARTFRYPLSSKELIMFWVLLLAVAEFFLFQAVLEVIVREPFVAVIWHGMLFVLIGILVAGVALRQVWAYPASIVVLLALFTVMLLGFMAGKAPEEAIAEFVGDDLVSVLSTDLDYVFLRSLLTVGDVLQFAVVTIALLYGIFKIGPDFERVQTRFIARVDRGLSDAPVYFATGQVYAKRGMWASAILHLRRAAASDPSRAYYQRVLGEAYAQLGYYERSLDVLESALEWTIDPDSRTYLVNLIEKVERNLAAEGAAIGTDRKS